MCIEYCKEMYSLELKHNYTVTHCLFCVLLYCTHTQNVNTRNINTITNECTRSAEPSPQV